MTNKRQAIWNRGAQRRGLRLRAVLCALLLLVLLPGAVHADIQSAADRYDAALMQLNAYLSQAQEVNLQGVIDAFEELEGYRESGGFCFYAEVLRELSLPDCSYTLLEEYMKALNAAGLDAVLEQEAFQTAYPFIHSVQALACYVQARKWEASWDRNRDAVSRSSAMEQYSQCINFFDASGRYKQLMRQQPATATATRKTEKTQKPTQAPTAKQTQTPTPLKVGKVVRFGRYEQDNKPGNGQEAIEWLVLDIRGSRALLIARYPLDAMPYHTSWVSVTWKGSAIRKWLNGTFMETAFNAKERKAILKTKLDNGDSQTYRPYGTYGGADTEDNVFLLSYAEAWQYFSSDSKRVGKPTAYAKAQGAYAEDGVGWWWLRSPGIEQTSGAAVRTNGTIDSHKVDMKTGGVRPALWFNLKYASLLTGK